MLDPQQQTEVDRRKAYMDGFKAGYENLYEMIANGVQRGQALVAVRNFWDSTLTFWLNSARAEPVDPPKM